MSEQLQQTTTQPEAAAKAPARVLSGINPSSAKGLHLGNFLGAVKPHIELQATGDCFYFVANLHAVNSLPEAEQLRHNTSEIFAQYLALGLDPEKTVFYVESDIHQLPLLQTILNNLYSVAELQRMHAFKDKLAKDTSIEQINNGLFGYPILMAADILAVNADVVPVGEDQSQHVEVARTLAKRFNRQFGEVFRIPRLAIQEQTARVKGIDGQRKMSKSLGNDLSIFAPEADLRKQINRITTDPGRIRATDPGDPSKNVTFEYLQLLDYPAAEIAAFQEQYRAGTVADSHLKTTLADHFLQYFAEARLKYAELIANPEHLATLRARGAERANVVVDAVMAKVRQAVGV